MILCCQAWFLDHIDTVELLRDTSISQRMFRHNRFPFMGGVTQGCPYPISQIFYPPISQSRFFSPNIPYPRFFTPQYPISQISQSIDHIPDFARLECVCIHSFDIQLVRMDPILLDIFIIAVNYTCAWAFGTAF